MRIIKLTIGLLAGMLAIAPCAAGTLFVGGDTTSTFFLSSPDFGGRDGNRAFYTNVLGDAKSVLISDRSFGVPGFPSFANGNLANFYRSMNSVSVAQTAGSITSDLLKDVGLLVLQFPDTAFTPTETGTIGDYVRAGGTLLLVGEGSTISPTIPAPNPAPGYRSNVIANDLLAGIGATMRLDNNAFGCCVATGSSIADNPFTKGVNSFEYGLVTSVSGGTPLIYATSQSPVDDRTPRPFFSVEMLNISAVPEPETWVLSILGFGITGAMLRRGRRRRSILYTAI